MALLQRRRPKVLQPQGRLVASRRSQALSHWTMSHSLNRPGQKDLTYGKQVIDFVGYPGRYDTAAVNRGRAGDKPKIPHGVGKTGSRGLTWLLLRHLHC